MFLRAVNRSVLVGALIAGLAAVAVTLALSSRILRPVERLTEAAQRMEKGDLTVRVPVTSEDEIGQLAHAFNSMAGSLAQQEQLRRNMVTDVAHELRTPLTNLRGYLEAARDGCWPPMTRWSITSTRKPCSSAVWWPICRSWRRPKPDSSRSCVNLHPRRHRGTGCRHPAAAGKHQGADPYRGLPADLPPVDVDPERVGQVLRNLLNNAVAHTPEGGEITVTAQAMGAEVAVAVHDTGAGIAPEHLPYVFDRFYRADKSRACETGGAGRALRHRKQLVVAHGGSISVDSAPGQGTTFTFTVSVAENT